MPSPFAGTGSLDATYAITTAAAALGYFHGTSFGGSGGGGSSLRCFG